MALHWNVKNVKDQDTVCWVKAEHDRPIDGIKAGDTIMSPVTNAIIWATIMVGMGKITEANWLEFYTRVNMMERWRGSMLDKEDGPRYLTKEDVRKHIGLSTNVSDEKRPAWFKRMFESALADNKRLWELDAAAAQFTKEDTNDA